MSKRKKQSRSKNDSSEPKPQPISDPLNGSSSSQVSPPKRNLPVLVVSVFLFVLWTLFLGYVALFG
ncbi:MAG: hypothetical protein H8E66_25730 [Planctomycetes bacterium]|nr:hypothetical protein [Planctomycetota bacterium]